MQKPVISVTGVDEVRNVGTVYQTQKFGSLILFLLLLLSLSPPPCLYWHNMYSVVGLVDHTEIFPASWHDCSVFVFIFDMSSYQKFMSAEYGFQREV